MYSKEVTENLFLFFSIELSVTCKESILKDGGFLKWWLILMHLQTLDLSDTQDPSAVTCAEGDIIPELVELEASQTHCVIYSSPLVAWESFLALFPVNSSYVLIIYIFLVQLFPSNISFLLLIVSCEIFLRNSFLNQTSIPHLPPLLCSIIITDLIGGSTLC